jgi:dipeptidyl aminopeptidase/acylaminoacyl peptidase
MHLSGWTPSTQKPQPLERGGATALAPRIEPSYTNSLREASKRKRTVLRTIHLSALLRFGVAGVASVCVFFGGRQSVADDLEFPSNEALRHLKKISDPQLAPDGTEILACIAEGAADGGKSHVWLISTTGAAARQLTFSPDADKGGEDSAQWMPDGQSILFLAHRGEHKNLFILPMIGGEARTVKIRVHSQVDLSTRKDALPSSQPGTAEDQEVDVIAYRISPDGRTIAFTAKDPVTPGEKKQIESKADAKWIDHDEHGSRIYLLNPATDKVTSVAIPVEIHDFTWSPDGVHMLVITQPPNHSSDLGPNRSLWMAAREDPDHPRHLAALPSTIESAAWSLDGKAIWYLAQAARDAPPGDLDLYRYEMLTQTIRNFSRDQPWSLRSVRPIALADRSAVVLTEQGVERPAMRYPGDGARPTTLRLSEQVVDAAVTNTTRSAWAFLGSGGGQSSQLYYSTDLDGPVRRLVLPDMGADTLRSSAPKRMEWKSDGRSVQGLLYLPPKSQTAPVPLLVEAHGGPLGQYADGYDPFADFILGQGWAVLKTNPRGSSGRGAEFAAANKNDLGGGDYRDIMAGVDYVLRTERVDSQRMAFYGYSYGGEMAGFVEGNTTRFKAIVSGAPVIDQYSEYGTEDDSWYDRWYFGKPWIQVADAWRQSPLAGASRARTPFLLLQGESDDDDPLSQSQEMYRALRQMNVPVDLIVYPRDNHGPLYNAIHGEPVPEPWHGFDARRRMVEFISKAFGQVH